MIPAAAQPRGRASVPSPRFLAQRLFSRRPNGRRSRYAHEIPPSGFRDSFAELAVIAVTGVSNHRSVPDPGFQRASNLVPRNRRFGLEPDLLRPTGRLAALPVLGPNCGQVEPPGKGKAGCCGGDGSTDRDATVFLRADRGALLAGKLSRRGPS